MLWVETAPTPARTKGQLAPTAKAQVATATANASVAGSCTTIDQVIATPFLARWRKRPHTAPLARTVAGSRTGGRRRDGSDRGRGAASRARVARVHRGSLPGTGVEADAFWSGLAGIIRDLAPRKPQPARPAATSCRPRSTRWHRAHRGKPLDAGRVRGVPARDRLSAAGAAPTSRSTTGNVDPEIATHRRAAARGARLQRPLRAQRRQRPLGQPLRRALRHRRDPGDGRRRARPRLQPGPRRAGGRQGASVPRRGRAARRRAATRTRTAYRGRGRRARRSTPAPAADRAWPTRRSSSATAASRPPSARPAAPQRPAHRDP